jgi:hypothetical protein
MRCESRRRVSDRDPLGLLHVVGAAWSGVEKAGSGERGVVFGLGARADQFGERVVV